MSGERLERKAEMSFAKKVELRNPEQTETSSGAIVAEPGTPKVQPIRPSCALSQLQYI